MGTGDGTQPPLKVDPDLLGKYGDQMLTSAGGLPAAPAPFVVSGADPISIAIAEKLPAIEGAILDELPRLKQDATTTASNIVSAAGRYSSTDQQLAAEYERHQFDTTGGSSAFGGGGSADSMGQMTGMPMQMAGQAMQMPMQAVSAMASVPQGIMQATQQGVQQIGQMTGAMGSPDAQQTARDAGGDEERAAARDAGAERAPEPTPRDTVPGTEVNL